MGTRTDSPCGCIEAIHRERVRYFPRQLITADDMMAEQQYFREKLRRHNRYLHGWGVVCGCEVKPYSGPDKDHPWQVRVCPGYLITPQGDEILITEPGVDFDLAGDWRQAQDPCARSVPCPPTGVLSSTDKTTIYLAACYTECVTRPVRVHPVGCACDEAACEYSRVRDSFELVRLLELPQSHNQAKAEDDSWGKEFKAWVKDGADKPKPVSDCPECPDDNCVVLATITLPDKGGTQIGDDNINYDERRVLYSVTALYPAMEVLPTGVQKEDQPQPRNRRKASAKRMPLRPR